MVIFQPFFNLKKKIILVCKLHMYLKKINEIWQIIAKIGWNWMNLHITLLYLKHVLNKTLLCFTIDYFINIFIQYLGLKKFCQYICISMWNTQNSKPSNGNKKISVEKSLQAIYIHSQTCIKRSPWVERKSGPIRQVTS